MRLSVLLFFLLWVTPVMAAPADETLSAAANQAFLAANAAKPGVVTRPDGLQYRIMSPGFGKRPGPADTVQIVYSGKLINGTLFDGASAGLPAAVSINALIRGMNEALQMMHAGERWQVVIPSNLGFGPAGAANGAIPPNQTLVFDITLVSISSVPQAPGGSPGIGFGVSASSQGREEQGHAVLSFPQ